MYSCVRFIVGFAPSTALLCRDTLPRAAYDPVHDAVLDGLLGPHYVVAVGVALDLLERLASSLGEDLVQAPLGAYELPRVDLYVRGLPPWPPLGPRLVYENPRVRQRVALAPRARGEQNSRYRGRRPERRRRHVRVYEAHGVVDGQTRRNAATRRIYIQVDVLLGVLAVEVQKLRDDGVCDL